MFYPVRAITTEKYNNTSGAPAATGVTAGTVSKFTPPTSTDTMRRNDSTTTINTKHQCVSAMKEYENFSLEVSSYPFVNQHI